MKKNQKIKAISFRQQGGTCHYCHQPIWLRDVSDFASRHGFTTRSAALLQATAEHLLARSEGGRDTSQNIVAACLFCNLRRHRAKRPLSPEAFGKKVRSQLAKGKWHGLVARNTTR